MKSGTSTIAYKITGQFTVYLITSICLWLDTSREEKLAEPKGSDHSPKYICSKMTGFDLNYEN
jgi:hypothetical protein